MNVYVGNLPYDFTKRDLEKMVEKFGDIRWVTIINDSKTRLSNGYGFVEFVTEKDGRHAIKELNGTMIHGKKLKVAPGTEQSPAESPLTFSEEEIQQLFGHEAAEDEDPERLREYYLKGDTYEQVTADLPLRIVVGHKGIGKSAMFQVAMQDHASRSELALLIKPTDIVEITTDDTDFLKAIRDWKIGLAEVIAAKILEVVGAGNDDVSSRMKKFGGQILKFVGDTFGDSGAANLDPARRLLIQNYLKDARIRIYVDDLDRGWEGRKADVKRISALLNAIRDISTEQRGTQFRVSLRSDVYYLVRTSDESTDKIEGSVVWLSWSNHDIYRFLAKRIETFFGNKVDESKLAKMGPRELSKSLAKVMEPRFLGRGHWKNAPTYRVLMSLIRKRPRDLVKLCWLAARAARKDRSNLIRTSHLLSVFEDYSQGRLQDTYNEYRSELPEIERLLTNMRPTKVELRAKEGYVYSTDSLIRKIKNIQQGGEFSFSHSGSRSKAEPKELLGFMFKINFLTARKDTPRGPIRRYFEENRYLVNEYVDFGFAWEVHPAYRWALQPQHLDDIFDNLELTLDSEDEDEDNKKKKSAVGDNER